MVEQSPTDLETLDLSDDVINFIHGRFPVTARTIAEITFPEYDVLVQRFKNMVAFMRDAGDAPGDDSEWSEVVAASETLHTGKPSANTTSGISYYRVWNYAIVAESRLVRWQTGVTALRQHNVIGLAASVCPALERTDAQRAATRMRTTATRSAAAAFDQMMDPAEEVADTRLLNRAFNNTDTTSRAMELLVKVQTELLVRQKCLWVEERFVRRFVGGPISARDADLRPMDKGPWYIGIHEATGESSPDFDEDATYGSERKVRSDMVSVLRAALVATEGRFYRAAVNTVNMDEREQFYRAILRFVGTVYAKQLAVRERRQVNFTQNVYPGPLLGLWDSMAAEHAALVIPLWNTSINKQVYLDLLPPMVRNARREAQRQRAQRASTSSSSGVEDEDYENMRSVYSDIIVGRPYTVQ